MILNSFINGIVVDTGPLLIHASGIFEEGRNLEKVTTPFCIEKPDAMSLLKTIDRLFTSTRRILVTPYVLSEFCNLAQRLIKLKNDRLQHFIESYSAFLSTTHDYNINKDILIEFQASKNFCFTDSSVALTAQENDIPLITIDWALKRWCESQGIEAKHIYYEIHLASMI